MTPSWIVSTLLQLYVLENNFSAFSLYHNLKGTSGSTNITDLYDLDSNTI